MIRFYLLPLVRVGIYRGPAYLKWRGDPLGLDCQWGMVDYGEIDQALVAADVTLEQHTALAQHADVYAFPETLDATISGPERKSLSDALEAAFIPAQWLAAGQTMREALRTVTGCLLFVQRLTTILGSNPLEMGITLNTRLGDLPAALSSALWQAAQEQGYDTTGLTPTTTLRQGLKLMADAWGDTPVLFGIAAL